MHIGVSLKWQLLQTVGSNSVIWKNDLITYARNKATKRIVSNEYVELKRDEFIYEYKNEGRTTVAISEKGIIELRNGEDYFRRNMDTLSADYTKYVKSQHVPTYLNIVRCKVLLAASGIPSFEKDKPTLFSFYDHFHPTQMEDITPDKQLYADPNQVNFDDLLRTGVFYTRNEFRRFLTTFREGADDQILGSRFSGIFFSEKKIVVVMNNTPMKNRILRLTPNDQKLNRKIEDYFAFLYRMNEEYEKRGMEPDVLVICDGDSLMYSMVMGRKNGRVTGWTSSNVNTKKTKKPKKKLEPYQTDGFRYDATGQIIGGTDVLRAVIRETLEGTDEAKLNKLISKENITKVHAPEGMKYFEVTTTDKVDRNRLRELTAELGFHIKSFAKKNISAEMTNHLVSGNSLYHQIFVATANEKGLRLIQYSLSKNQRECDNDGKDTASRFGYEPYSKPMQGYTGSVLSQLEIDGEMKDIIYSIVYVPWIEINSLKAFSIDSKEIHNKNRYLVLTYPEIADTVSHCLRMECLFRNIDTGELIEGVPQYNERGYPIGVKDRYQKGEVSTEFRRTRKPKSSKNKAVTFSMSNDMEKLITEKAKELGMTRSKYLKYLLSSAEKTEEKEKEIPPEISIDDIDIDDFELDLID